MKRLFASFAKTYPISVGCESKHSNAKSQNIITQSQSVASMQNRQGSHITDYIVIIS